MVIIEIFINMYKYIYLASNKIGFDSFNVTY